MTTSATEQGGIRRHDEALRWLVMFAQESPESLRAVRESCRTFLAASEPEVLDAARRGDREAVDAALERAFGPEER